MEKKYQNLSQNLYQKDWFVSELACVGSDSETFFCVGGVVVGKNHLNFVGLMMPYLIFLGKKFEKNRPRIRKIFTYSLSNQGFIFESNEVEIGQEANLWELVLIKRKLK